MKPTDALFYISNIFVIVVFLRMLSQGNPQPNGCKACIVFAALAIMLQISERPLFAQLCQIAAIIIMALLIATRTRWNKEQAKKTWKS